MKKIILIILVAITTSLKAQLVVDAGGLTVKGGEILVVDGLSLTPSSNYTLTNTTLAKTEAYTITPTPTNYYIKRYFKFSNTTSPFTGTILFSYAGADLNGSNSVAIPQANLRMNITNGTTWSATADAPVTASSYVSSAVAAISLNTITLANQSAPLPITWISFTAEKKNNGAILKWATATEANSKDFMVQHSLNGSDWNTIGSVKAAGNSNSVSAYNFTHTFPLPGTNYYRLIQRDLDERYSNSNVISLNFDRSQLSLQAFPNPVLDGKLSVVLPASAAVQIFNAAGKLVYQRQLLPGLQQLDIRNLASGTYWLKAGKESIQIFVK
ncbi:T9SS type A sorting domain-containing protein [Ferruginibacter sp. SUN106]|uniref:T9SS type A sorting domain-containing protein n=1 Tax=Ferruginibacter sp. SUN106 TaxID=2978348 RepID=UPI003D35A8EC